MKAKTKAMPKCRCRLNLLRQLNILSGCSESELGQAHVQQAGKSDSADFTA
jgi:hypothetical protein